MPIEHRIRTSERTAFRQLRLLAAGVCGLWLAHQVPRLIDGGVRSATIATAVVVAVALGAVGRGTQTAVATAFSDLHRVFRSRHLLACTALLSIAGILVVLPVATTRPFGHLFAHGQITGEELADVGSLTGAVICAVAAIVTAVGAWDASHDERHWHRSLGAGHHR